MEQCGQTNGCERGMGCLDEGNAEDGSWNEESGDQWYSEEHPELMVTGSSGLLGSGTIGTSSSNLVGLG